MSVHLLLRTRMIWLLVLHAFTQVLPFSSPVSEASAVPLWHSFAGTKVELLASTVSRKCRSGVHISVPDLSEFSSGLDINDAVSGLDLPQTLGSQFACLYEFHLYLTSGSHSLELTSNDGSLLLVNGAQIINNDGQHTAQTVSATLDLVAQNGGELFQIPYFQNDGSAALDLIVDGYDFSAFLSSSTTATPYPTPKPTPEPTQTPTDTCSTRWEEHQGIIMIEAERVDFRAIDNRWTKERLDGEVYLEFDKDNAQQSIFKVEEVGKLCYPVTFSSTGWWKFKFKNVNRHGTEHNDAWVRIMGLNWIVAKPGADIRNPDTRVNKGDNYLKAYRNRDPNTWRWDTFTIDHNGHEFYFKINTAGYSTDICFAGRSTKFGVGKLVLYNVDMVSGGDSEAQSSAETLAVCPTPEPTPVPSPQPTPIPTPAPSPQPTSLPTPKPTPQPTSLLTPKPTPQPTPKPTPTPTPDPTPHPTPDSTTPTSDPTSEPIPDHPNPTPEPTPTPTPDPSVEPGWKVVLTIANYNLEEVTEILRLKWKQAITTFLSVDPCVVKILYTQGSVNQIAMFDTMLNMTTDTLQPNQPRTPEVLANLLAGLSSTQVSTMLNASVTVISAPTLIFDDDEAKGKEESKESIVVGVSVAMSLLAVGFAAIGVAYYIFKKRRNRNNFQLAKISKTTEVHAMDNQLRHTASHSAHNMTIPEHDIGLAVYSNDHSPAVTPRLGGDKSPTAADKSPTAVALKSPGIKSSDMKSISPTVAGWKQYFDDASAQPYWYNHGTGESTWIDPNGPQSGNSGARDSTLTDQDNPLEAHATRLV